MSTRVVTQVRELIDSDPSWRRGFTENPSETLRPQKRARPLPPPSGGVVLGREVIGQGGMGVVLAATQSRVARQVAVKKLHPDHTRDAAARVGLLQEAWLTGALEHPGIVPVYDIDVDGTDEPLVVMKRIDGTSWAELIANPHAVQASGAGSDVLAWHLNVLARVCDAVHMAHSRGIVHRDIKPQNVMIGRFGEVYLLDWGLAVALDDDQSGRFPLAREVSSPAGTPAYMAPEQLDEHGDRLGLTTDVYLLGAVLYHIVAGHPPHRGQDPLERLDSILHGPPPLPPSVPKGLARIVADAMALDPAARTPTAVDFKRELVEFLAHRGSERLAQAALAATEELERIAAGPIESDTLQRSVRAFAEARFGFRLARESWPENPDVVGGTSRAARAGVEAMLRAGFVDTAAALVASMSHPPDDVKERVDRAVEEAKRAQEQLQAVARDYDIHRGRRFRAALAAVLGLAASASVLVNHVRLVRDDHERSPLVAVLVAAAFFAFVVGIRVVFRKDIDTLLNRKYLSIAAVTTAFGALLRLALLALVPDQAALLGDQLIFVVWAMGCIALATSFEPRVWPAGASYVVGLLVAVVWPELRYLAAGACHLMLTANAYWVLARRRSPA